MNLVWCMAVALFAATSAEPVNSTPPAAAAAHAPAVLPVMQSVVRHAASDDLKEFDHSGYSFKSDIAEMASGKYPVGFVGGKARLAKDSKKLEFFGILNNDEVILVLDNFDTTQFSGNSDAFNFLKLKVGDQDVEFQFTKYGDNVNTYVKFGSNAPISAHVTLKNNGKLRVHLTRNGIKIDDQIPNADLSVKTPWSVVKTSSGKEAMKVTIDASGMREASFDLQLETPFGESAEVALLAGLKVWHWGLIGLAIAVIVGGFVLFVCSRWEKCPLHKKMCFKNKGQAVKDKEEAMPEEGTQPEQKHLTEETKADKPPVKREVSVSRDQPSRVSRDAVSSHQATLKVATTQWNYQDRKEADEGGYENLDPAEDEGKQKKASEKPKRDGEKLTKPKGPEIVYMKETKKPVKDGKESAEGKKMEKVAGSVEPDKPMIAPKSDGLGKELAKQSNEKLAVAEKPKKSSESEKEYEKAERVAEMLKQAEIEKGLEKPKIVESKQKIEGGNADGQLKVLEKKQQIEKENVPENPKTAFEMEKAVEERKVPEKEKEPVITAVKKVWTEKPIKPVPVVDADRNSKKEAKSSKIQAPKTSTGEDVASASNTGTKDVTEEPEMSLNSALYFQRTGKRRPVVANPPVYGPVTCWVQPPAAAGEEAPKESNLKASAPVVEKETKKIDEKKAKRRKSPVQEEKRIEKRRKKERRLAESDSYRSSRREESQRRVNSVRLKVDAVHRDDMLRNNVKPPEKPRKKKTRGSTPRKRTTRGSKPSKQKPRDGQKKESTQPTQASVSVDPTQTNGTVDPTQDVDDEGVGG